MSVVESYVYTDSLFNVQSQCSTSKKDLISLLHKLAQTWVLMRNRVTGAFNPLFCPHPHTSRTSYILHRYTLINTKIRTYISTRTDTHKHNHMRKMIVQRNTKIFTEHFHCIWLHDLYSSSSFMWMISDWISHKNGVVDVLGAWSFLLVRNEQTFYYNYVI